MNQNNIFIQFLDILSYEKDDEREFLVFALNQALKLTSSKYGYIYLYNEDKNEFTLNTWSKDVMDDCKVLNPQTVYKLEKTGLWGETIRQRKEIIVNDFDKPNPLKKGYPQGHVEIKKFLTIPIFSKDKIIAVVGVANKQEDYDENDVNNLKLFMNIVFKELSRRKLTNELKLEKNWSKNIINNAPVIIIGLKEESKIAIFNHYAEKITGYSAKEVIGKKWIDLFIAEDDKTEIWNEWNKIVKNKLINDTHRNFILTKNNEKLLIHWNNIVLTENDEFYMVLSIGIDITKLYNTEEELKLQNQKQSILLDVATIFLKTVNLNYMFENIALAVAKLKQDILCAVYVLTDDKLYLYSAWPPSSGDFFEDIKVIELKNHPQIRKSLDTKSNIYIKDITSIDLTEEEKRIVKDKKLKGLLYLPLYYENKIYGILIVGTQNESICFSDKEVELYEILAKFASLKLEDINTHLEKQKHIKDLEELTKKQDELLERLNESEERFRRLYNNAQDIIYRYDFLPQPHFTYVNDAVTRIVGYTPEEHYADPFLGLKIVHPDDRYILEDMFKSKIDEYKVVNIRYLSKSGQIIHIEQRNVPIYDEKGNLVAIEGIARDITERIKAEEERQFLQQQLMQVQKMESIGMLAGGIAHDYNNMLGIILGYAEQLQNRFDKNDPVQEDIAQIISAAKTTKDLTQQLLAFGRKQTLMPKVININNLLKSMEKILRRTLREDIELKFLLSDSLDNILVDPVQMQQIILNLVVNAREAMPNGGSIIIETKNVFFDENYVNTHVGIKVGSYVMFSITDTGHGMDKETLSRIFEPFFTTKEKGKGLGLGLSTVYGIVKQSGGNIWAYSEVGKGTTFKIYFPSTKEKEEEQIIKFKDEEVKGNGKKILLVEDEENLRKIMKKMIEKLGYEVIETKDSYDALSIIEQKNIVPSCILTDVIMPGMNGKQLVDKIKEKLPDIKVLFMSGYTDNAIVHHGVLEEGVEFIQKPFMMKELGEKLNKIFQKD